MTDQLPAHLLTRKSLGLAQSAVSGLSGGAPAHISIARNRFTLVDAAGTKKPVDTLYLDVVVVDVNPAVSKVYYDGPFDPTAEDHKPPTCFSDNGKGASANAQQPQSVSCMMCPHNVWGSDTSKVTGKGTKACNDYKKLAVILPGDEDEITYMLRVPPATLKGWKAYAQTIGSRPLPDKSRNFDLSDLVTRVTFDADTQGVLNFKPIGYIDEVASERIDEIWADKSKTMTLVGTNDVLVPADRVQLVAGNGPPVTPKAQAPQPKAPVTSPVEQQFLEAPQATAPKPRGRPKKPTPDAAPPAGTTTPVASAQPAGEAEEIPPFLRRQQAASPSEPPPDSRPSFGLEQPKAMPSGLEDELAKAFALPT